MTSKKTPETPNANETTTVDSRLERQQPLALVPPRAVHVIGVGGVGTWLALFLGLAGTKRLILWDHDQVSESNLNRLPFKPGAIGTNKAQAMCDLLESMVPGIQITVISERWTDERATEIGYGDDLSNIWLVACTDTLQSRRDIFAHAEAKDLLYIEASANGEFGGCAGSPALFATDKETQAGYASVPVWVGPCVAAAMMTCAHILHDVTPGESNYRLGWNGETNRVEAQFEHEAEEVPQAKTA